MTTESCKFGLLFDVRNPEPWSRPWPTVIGEAIDLAAGAEELGAESIWATEHHGFEDGYLSQPLTFLAAAATRTRSVRLGTGVLLASMRHPRHISEQVALLDNLSGGRIEIGVGAGYAPHEFETFGQDIARRMTLADQRISELQEDLWRPVLNPPPVQDQVPLWLGYQGPQGARRAGRLGVGLLSPNPKILEPYREGLLEGGHDPQSARMGGLIPMVLAEDPERTAPLVAPHYAHQLRTYQQVRGIDDPEATPLDDVVRGLLDPSSPGLRVVTPETAATELAAVLEAAPVRHLYFWATVAAMPAALVEEHVRLVFTDLVPRLRPTS